MLGAERRLGDAKEFLSHHNRFVILAFGVEFANLAAQFLQARFLHFLRFLCGDRRGKYKHQHQRAKEIDESSGHDQETLPLQHLISPHATPSP